ncbi:hypothetical protein DL96DRAFT_1597190 [Flagelloscypha sp. PMI_526]|nr:hypothetical protein DL96DRAFT_1597190 [Flagelloscypha sp. PMI_526]
METSYQLISSYKKRITTLDRAIELNATTTTPRGDSTTTTTTTQASHGPVEYRKLIQRFRQFLAEEEKFWAKLVLRICRSFSLTEARPTLVTLGLVSTEREIDENIKDGEVRQQAERNQAFPPEDSTVIPPTPEQRPGRLAILAKSLTCLGDIARYRELYNESGGRPKAGHEDVPSRGSVGQETHFRPRNYEKSQRCYEGARLLLPSEGNASHQLAILASYKRDDFTSIFHYYRSLCVKKPYEPASDNIDKVLNRSLEEWKQKQASEPSAAPSPQDPPRIRINYFREQIVVLHALWRFGKENTEALTRKLGLDICQEFYSLLSDRHLPSDMINTIVVMGQAALWRQRMLRENGRKTSGSIPSSSSEYRLLAHILGLYRSLLDVGLEQLKDMPTSDVHDGDLGQHISAIFRRTLPAIRIFSKWLRCQLQYVNKWAEGLAVHSRDKQHADQKLSKRQKEIREFWEVYARFARVLSRAFPSHLIPRFDGPLDEDTDMRGFLPLKGMMDSPSGIPSESKELPHPNDTELMRIFDLIQDTREIVASERSPLAIYGDNFVLKGVESANAPDFLLPGQNMDAGLTRSASAASTEVDDDQRTETTDDDPVRDAFKFIDRPDSSVDGIDDDVEEIERPANIGPALSPISPRSAPVRDIVSPPEASPSTPNAPMSSKTTASDLLASIMGPDPGREKSSAVSTFTSPAAIGPSIWSASTDERPLAFGPGQGSPLRPRAPSYSRREHMEPTPWSTSPYLSHAPAAPSMAPYAPQPIPDVYPPTSLSNLSIGPYSQPEAGFHPSQSSQIATYDPLAPGPYSSQGPPHGFNPHSSQHGFPPPFQPHAGPYQGFDDMYHSHRHSEPLYPYSGNPESQNHLTQPPEAPQIWGNAG